MQTVLDGLLALPIPVVVVLAALILAGEPAFLPGMVLPSVSTALGLGFLVDNGTIGLPTAVVTAVGAVIAGDLCAYVVGRRRSGRRPAAGHRRRAAFLQRRLDGAMDRAAALFGRHGGRAVFVARWVVGARTLVPRLAGAGGMSARAFLCYSVPAGVLWSVCWVSAGRLAGSSYRQVSAVAGQVSLGLIVAAVAIAAGITAGRRLGRHSGVSPAVLVGALALVGSTLTALVALAVRAGGLPRVDEPVAAALDSASRGGLNRAAELVLLSTPSSAMIALAAVVVVLRPVRSPKRRGALGLLASGGAVMPLVMLVAVLTVAEALTRTEHLFAVQQATSTTAIALATWAVARKQAFRPLRGATWTVGVAAVLALAAGRIYLGWGPVSSTVAALLIGAAWAAVFAAAWAAAPVDHALTADGAASGSDAAHPTEDPAAEYGHRATPVNHAVVQIRERLHLGPVVTRRTRLAAGSTVQLEHDRHLLTHLHRLIPVPGVSPVDRHANPYRKAHST